MTNKANQVSGSQKEIIEYINHHLLHMENLKKANLKDWQIELFGDIANELSETGTHKLFQPINTDVESDEDTEMIKKTSGDEHSFIVLHGLQVFFIKKILEY